MAASIAVISAAFTVLKQGLDAGLNVNQLVIKSLKDYNSLDEVRLLEIRVTNLHPQMKLRLEDSWFDSGRFWSQPFTDVYPGQSVTFHVRSSSATNNVQSVSGGVGFRVMDKDSNEIQPPGWFICTFSNPWFGSIKGKVAFKDLGIKPLWDTMFDAEMIQDDWIGFYRRSDRVLQFVFKSPEVKW